MNLTPSVTSLGKEQLPHFYSFQNWSHNLFTKKAAQFISRLSSLLQKPGAFYENKTIHPTLKMQRTVVASFSDRSPIKSSFLIHNSNIMLISTDAHSASSLPFLFILSCQWMKSRSRACLMLQNKHAAEKSSESTISRYD